jgi:putative DNA primase/helicase
MGVLRQARGTAGLTITVAEMADNPYLLNLANGTYDLETDTFRGHQHEDYCFYVCDTNYVADAKAPLWDKVLSDVFAGDTDLIKFAGRMFGNGVSGDISDPLFYILYGSGANGKSTIVQTISGLLGEYATDLPSELFDKNQKLHPTYLAKLHKARLAVVAELESDVSLAEATIKKVTSQDAIEARRMREDPWSFKPTHTSVLCTNHKPSVKGSDIGIWRRLRLLPFEVNLTSVKDVTIPERLKLEYAGILNWLIQGYRDCKAQGGVGSCKAVDDATAEYKSGEDEFKRLTEDLFTEREGAVLTVIDAFQAFVQSGGRLGRKKFNSEMDRIGHKQSRVRLQGAKPYCYTGLTLTSLTSEF